MAVTVRLARHGTQKAPYYRIVVADQRDKRDGRFLEQLGTYDPRQNPEVVRVDEERLGYWIGQGARPSSTVKELVKRLRRRRNAAAK